MIDNQPRLDWTNLPPSSVSESLWASLHDGKLIRVFSDSLGRTIELELDIPHIRQRYNLGDKLHFFITLQSVESVRASTYSVWPGVFPKLEGKTFEEQNRLVEEYQAMSREESIGWTDFEAAFSANTLNIYSAELAQNENTTTLQVQGAMDGDEFDDKYFNIFIRASKILFWQSKSLILTLEQFVKLGEDYWSSNVEKVDSVEEGKIAFIMNTDSV
jgi:hypothetical protein